MNNRDEYTFEFGDELYHWKYIKRVRDGDKWKYYYDWDELKSDVSNKLGVTAKEELDKAKETAANAKSDYETATKKRNEAKNKVETIKNSKDTDGKKNTNMVLAKRNLNSADKTQKEKLNKAVDSVNKVMDAKNEFSKTPLGKVTQAKETIEKGINRVKTAAKKLAATPYDSYEFELNNYGKTTYYKAKNPNSISEKSRSFSSKEYMQRFNEETGQYELVRRSDGTVLQDYRPIKEKKKKKK